MDLLECALGKQWHRTTASAIQAFPPIYDALKSEKQRAVVLAHSQQKDGRKRGGQHGRAPYELIDADAFPDTTLPRLFSYINGGSPATS